MQSPRTASARFAHVFHAALLLALCLPLAGCFYAAAAGAGAGTALYVMGDLEKTFNADFNSVHGSAVSMLKSQGLPILSEEIDSGKSVIKSEYLNGDKIKITVESMTRHTTKVYVRIGIFGDETRSRDLMQRIESRL